MLKNNWATWSETRICLGLFYKMHFSPFGFKIIPSKTKSRWVQDLFSSVSSKYDSMNDLMSWGLHRLWKDRAVNCLELRPHHRVLDLACGTGDLTQRIHPRLNASQNGLVIPCDPNADMMKMGQGKLLEKGIAGLQWTQAYAESLPFPQDSFHRVIMGFGLRNTTDRQQSLLEIHRVLKTGGQLVLLELFTPQKMPWQTLHKAYTLYVLPQLGKLVVDDGSSYRYLAESIQTFVSPQVLSNELEQVGFKNVSFQPLTLGSVCIHVAYKI